MIKQRGSMTSTRNSLGKGPVFWVFLLVIALWASSLMLVPLAATVYYNLVEEQASEPEDGWNTDAASKMTVYGTFGDSFGAINALFSGLALAGVVLALFFNSENAKRVNKPFVIAMLRKEDSARVTVKQPTRTSAIVSLPLSISLPVKNSSDHPALNLDLSLKVQGVKGQSHAVTDIPLASNGEVICELSIDISGTEATRFVDVLCAEGVEIVVTIEYESIEGVRWLSQASYLLAANKSRPDDADMLRQAINGQLTATSLWAAETTVDLDFSTVSGSWIYGESAGSRSRK